MAGFTSVGANVVRSIMLRELGRAALDGLRGTVVAEPAERGENKSADQDCLDESIHFVSPPQLFAST